MGNMEIIHRMTADYNKKILEDVEQRCRKFCEALCINAIQERKNAPGAHDFTGNLITSIVVCLYKNGSPLDAWYAADREKRAIRIKMRPRPDKKPYFFPVDYSGKERTFYTVPDDSPQIDKPYGVNDAKAFFQNYRPKGNNLFDIVVAYPVEYAGWVEQHRATTGIVQSFSFAKRVSVEYLKLEKVS